MVDFVAQATQTSNGDTLLYVVAGIIALATGGGGVVAGRKWQKGGTGDGDAYNQRLCDERHSRIDLDISEIKKDLRSGFTGIYERIENLHNAFKNGNQG